MFFITDLNFMHRQLEVILISACTALQKRGYCGIVVLRLH